MGCMPTRQAQRLRRGKKKRHQIPRSKRWTFPRNLKSLSKLNCDLDEVYESSNGGSKCLDYHVNSFFHSSDYDLGQLNEHRSVQASYVSAEFEIYLLGCANLIIC